jgi:predicted AlkP superfamily phosphohydrolase/phosphomutase
VESHLYFSDIDWSRTQVYATYDELVSRGLRINLLGREPQGIVRPGAEYEALRNSLVKKIEALRRPDSGEEVVNKVHLRENLYHGPHADAAPDLVIEWRDEAFFSTRPTADSTQIDGECPVKLSNLQTTGDHRPNGILIAYGRGIREDRRIGPFDIKDVASTVLYAMGVPVPRNMDGRVLTELFEDSYLANRPIIWGSTTSEASTGSKTSGYTEEETRVIRERLRGIGYLE